MNKSIKALLWVLLVGMITGCEDFKLGNAFLEKAPGDDVDIDVVFSNKKYADQVLNQAYRSLPDYLPMESRGYRGNWGNTDGVTDICYNRESAYVSGSLKASYEIGFPYYPNSTTQNIGNPLYGIRKAYIYLENVDRVPDMTGDEKKQRKAEMKVIIAYHYSQMLRHYGGLPWIDHAYNPDDSFQFPRLTLEETVSKIVTLLDEAAADLPWYASDAEYGHPDGCRAKALKLRVCLFVASPLFNNDAPYMDGEAAAQKLTWFGDYRQERWRDALNAGLEFLRLNEQNDNYHEIVKTGDDARQNYVDGYWKRGSKEIIMASHRYPIYDMSMKSLDRGHNDWYISTRSSYADMFEWKDGTPFSWDNPNHEAHPFFDENMKPTRDPRLYETLIINQDKFQKQNGGAQCYQGGLQSKENSKYNKSSIYGYSIRKFVRDKGEEVKNQPYQCPLVRMPEVYLSIAEAMNQLGIAKQKDEFGRDAYDYINLVRNRVGMPDVREVEGQELVDILLHERVVEFGAEEMRYFDLIRWKRADLLSTPVETLNIVKNADGSFTYERSTTEQKYDWKDHWYLIAFSQDEINKKYGLIQNPGW